MSSDFNRLGNCKNHYQGSSKRVLCVCSAGLLRSPTIAAILHTAFDYNTRSAGSDDEFALIKVDDVLIHWAEEIVFAEEHHKHTIADKFDLSGKKLIVLDIPDRYSYMDNELIKLIIYKYQHIAEE